MCFGCGCWLDQEEQKSVRQPEDKKVTGFGFNNDDLEGEGPFNGTNVDTGVLNHSDKIIQIPKEFGLSQEESDCIGEDGEIIDLPSRII